MGKKKNNKEKGITGANMDFYGPMTYEERAVPYMGEKKPILCDDSVSLEKYG